MSHNSHQPPAAVHGSSSAPSNYPYPSYTFSQSQTLPPLHQTTQPAGLHGILGGQYSAPHTSRTPPAPTQIPRLSSAPSFSQASVSHIQPSSIFAQSNHQHYGQPSQNMMLVSSQPQSFPQPIAPAPPRDARPLQDILPYPGRLEQQQQRRNATDGLMDPSAFHGKDGSRTHVVGSQGRRGVLPSAPGREAVPSAAANSVKNPQIPQKDADGKFPCPHCSKTYLHAKHLKRHLLRRK